MQIEIHPRDRPEFIPSVKQDDFWEVDWSTPGIEHCCRILADRAGPSPGFEEGAVFYLEGEEDGGTRTEGRLLYVDRREETVIAPGRRAWAYLCLEVVAREKVHLGTIEDAAGYAEPGAGGCPCDCGDHVACARCCPYYREA